MNINQGTGWVDNGRLHVSLRGRPCRSNLQPPSEHLVLLPCLEGALGDC